MQNETSELEQVPTIIEQMRERGFGLGCYIHEHNLKPDDLQFLDQHELRMLRSRTDREELLEKISELIS